MTYWHFNVCILQFQSPKFNKDKDSSNSWSSDDSYLED